MPFETIRQHCALRDIGSSPLSFYRRRCLSICGSRYQNRINQLNYFTAYLLKLTLNPGFVVLKKLNLSGPFFFLFRLSLEPSKYLFQVLLYFYMQQQKISFFVREISTVLSHIFHNAQIVLKPFSSFNSLSQIQLLLPSLWLHLKDQYQHRYQFTQLIRQRLLLWGNKHRFEKSLLSLVKLDHLKSLISQFTFVVQCDYIINSTEGYMKEGQIQAPSFNKFKQSRRLIDY